MSYEMYEALKEAEQDLKLIKIQKIDLVKENIMLKNRIIDLEAELQILKQEG